MEDIDRLFKNCELTRQIWNTVSDYCPNQYNGNMQFIDWIEFIQKHEKVYDRIFRKPLEKIVVIAWSIWTHMNYAIFKNRKVQPAQVINLTSFIFDDMMYYNAISDF